MYDPVTARFLQADTYLGNQSDPLSLNLYTYCLNNPERYIDPSGHIALELAAVVIFSVIVGMAAEIGAQKFIEKKVCIDYNRVVEEGLFSGLVSVLSLSVGVLKSAVGPLAAESIVSAQGAGLTKKTLASALISSAVGGAASEAAEEIGHQLIIEARQPSRIDYRRVGVSAAFGTLIASGSTLAGASLNHLKEVRAAKKVEKAAKSAGNALPTERNLRYFAGDVVEGGTGAFKYIEVKTFTAEETNQWFIDNVKPDYKPPYKPGTVVSEIELTGNTTFVRVYDNMPDGSGMYGSWVMKAADIEGLTPLEIQNKFALPNTPKYVCDVELEAGAHIRVGKVNPLEGWGSGGGIQYDLIGQRIGNFKNERLLGGK